MFNWKTLTSGAAVSIMALAAAPVAEAQVTTSSIRGQVTSEAGAPVSGATVTVVNLSSGLTRSIVTDASGSFYVRNLPVGGYSVEAAGSNLQAQRIDNVGLNLGDTTDVNLVLEPSADDTRMLDAIVVTSSAANTGAVAVGPSATFGLQTLQSAPAINRDIRDIIRTDPRLFIDEGDVDGLQCAGGNPRFNSLTVDGVRLNDSFGLNSSGFPTERQPFSFDAIEQVAVELAPFDVQYGGFTACNINAVTKSGGNEFHGALFFDTTNDTLTGSSLEDDDVDVGDFTEERYGFSIGGPIVQDKLFFFASYEKLEGANRFDRGPVGSGAVNEVLGLTQADLNEIAQIARDVYQYDPGVVPVSFPNEDEKLLVRLDWDINNNHRANFVYNYNDGFNIVESDGDADEFEFSNHLYERGAELNSYVGSVFSDWTDKLSTEFRLGYIELDNRQISVGGTDFGEIQVRTQNGPNRATVYLGGDDSRQSNKLSYDLWNFVARANYQLNNQHLLTFGYEREQLEIFNLFIQHSETEIRFSSIDDFRNGVASRLEYNNAPSNNPGDAAADWGYAINTLYAQDEWALDNGLTIVAGLRYDFYESDDVPEENVGFTADYGFSNSENLDGADLLQPRLGFTWDVNDDLSLRGGVGLYSGGNPNVWLSNNYSGNNVLQFGARLSDGGLADLFAIPYTAAEEGVPNAPGYAIPQEVFDSVATGTGRNFEINALDPDFDLPSEWKYALGATYFLDVPIEGPASFLGGEYVLNGDVQFSQRQDNAVIRRLDLVPAAPIIGGLIPQFDSPAENDAFILTNGEDTEAFNVGVSVSKDYDNGIDWTFGYSYTDSEDELPMTSSVAFSNYNNRAFVNPNAPGVATSNFEIQHRFTFLANFEKEFIQGFPTKLSVFGQANEGRPISFAFDNANNFFGFTPFLDDDPGAGGLQLYIPTGPSDPLVQFGPDFDQEAFFEYLADNDLNQFAGGFAERNGVDGSWWSKIDLKFEQEFPGLRPQDNSSAFIIIDNFTNLLNDEWGILNEATFPQVRRIVDGAPSDDNTQFVFNEFIPLNAESRVGSASLWSIRLGVRYEF